MFWPLTTMVVFSSSTMIFSSLHLFIWRDFIANSFGWGSDLEPWLVEIKKLVSFLWVLIFIRLYCSESLWERELSRTWCYRDRNSLVFTLSEWTFAFFLILQTNYVLQLAEQQREMELERKQRQGMKMFNHPREYCAMCDLHFFGHLISHRKNVRHQVSWLHRRCTRQILILEEYWYVWNKFIAFLRCFVTI